jgi:hypothetical protein
MLLYQQLAELFTVIGLDMKDESLDDFRLRLKDGLKVFGECGKVDKKTWSGPANHIFYLATPPGIME